MGCCQSKPVTQDLGGLAEENPLRMHQLHQQPLKLAMLVRVGRMLYVPKERSPDGYPEAYCIVTLEGSDSSKGQLPPSNLRQNKQQHTSAKNHSSEIVWNENVELSTPSGSANGLTLVINVYDKDTFSSDDFIGVAKVPASEWEPHLDRGTRIKRELQDVPLDRWELASGKMPQIIFRVYTPEMGAIITSADAFYETTMCLCSELQLLGSLVTVWESFWADQFPFEGNRPCLIWRSRPCSSSDVAWASLESQDDPMFPRDVFKDMTGFGGDGDCKWSMWKSAYQPTASALKAVSVMKEWAAHILSKHGEDAVVLNVEGKPMTSGAMHSFLKEVIRKHRSTNELAKQEEWASPMPVRYGILGGMGPMAAATYTRLLSNQVHTGTEAELVMLNDPRIENQSIMEAGTLIGTALRFNDFMKFTGFEKTSCSSNTWHLVLHINRPPGLISICDATADLIQEKFPGQTVGLLCTTKSAKYAANGGYGSAFDERGIKWGSISDDIQDKTMDAINLIKNPVDGSVSFREARQTILDVMMWHIETNGVTVFGLCCTEIPLVIDQAVVDDYEPMKGRGIAVVSSMDALAARFSAAINERKARLGMEPAA